MNSFPITASDIQRDYKSILNKIKTTGERGILMNRDQPQAVIITLDEANELDQYRRRNSGQNLLNFAQEVRLLLKEEPLPNDLAQNHDYYLWEEPTKPNHE